MEYFFPKYFSFSINAAPQFLSMSWSLSKRTLELKWWWLFNWICLQTNDEDLISAKLLHENWNALGYSSVYIVVHLQFFLTNATDWIGTIGIDDLNDSSITKVKKLGNMEVLFYWFLQMPILCSTEKNRLKILLISKNAIQSQFFAHYSVPKQKESMNIKRNTHTVWENHLKSLIQNGEWSELRWHFH